MFEIGWTEMLVIAVVMIVVVGPKDLPKMLRTFGRTTAKLRAMAGDFQKQFNEALKEAELDDVKKSVDSLRSLNPAAEIRKQLNPFEKAAADVRAGLDTAMKPKPAEPLKNGAPAVDGEAKPEAAAIAREPLKNGAAEAVAGPGAMPPPAVFPAMADPAPAKPAGAGAKAAKPVKAGAPAKAAKTTVAAKPAAPIAKAPVAKPSAKPAQAAKAAPKPKAARKPAGSKP